MSAQQEYKELYAKYKAAIDKISTVTAERDRLSESWQLEHTERIKAETHVTLLKQENDDLKAMLKESPHD